MPLNYKHLFTNNSNEEWAELMKYLSLDKMTAVEFATNAVRDYIKKCEKHYEKMQCMKQTEETK